MRVLVTGSTGFIGSHIVESFSQKGFALNTLARNSWSGSIPHQLKKTNIFFGDINDSKTIRNAVKGVDVVIHTASLLGRWQNEFPYSEFYRVNVGGTKTLIDASQKEGVAHFIYLSTVGVMGRLQIVPSDETAPLSPTFAYAISKYHSEKMLGLSIADGFPATILRPSHVYGPRDKNTVKVFKIIKKLGIFPLMGGGNALFQPIYVDDVVRALLTCIEKKEKCIGKIYLVAGKELLTYQAFLFLSAKILGVPLKTFVLSERLANPFAAISEKLFTSFNREPPLTRSRVDFFSRNQAYKIEKIFKELGFFPKVTLATGLRKTIDWCTMNNLL